MSESREREDAVRRLVRQAGRPGTPPAWAGPAALVCLVVGVVVFVIALLLLPRAAWGALLANFLFWTGLSQAGVVVAAVFQIAPSRWGRTVQRIAIGLGAFLPFSIPILMALWFGRGYLFWWLLEDAHNLWLVPTVLFARDLLLLIIAVGLSLWYLYLSLRPDAGALREPGVPDRGGLTGWLTRDWRGLPEERERSRRLLRILSPALVLVYAFVYSVLAIDLSMTLVPHFRSTMFPAIYFLTQFYAALAVTAVLAHLWRGWGGLEEILTPPRFLDLGNLVWGFAIFSAYVYWAQYIVVWDVNFPHEAHHHIERWRVLPWSAVSWVALLLMFIIPFVTLFGRWVKSSPSLLALVAGLGALGVLFQRYLDVLPFVPPHGATGFGLVELGVSLGFLGGMALSYLWLMRRVPLFPVEDPLFAEAIALQEGEG